MSKDFRNVVILFIVQAFKNQKYLKFNSACMCDILVLALMKEDNAVIDTILPVDYHIEKKKKTFQSEKVCTFLPKYILPFHDTLVPV